MDLKPNSADRSEEKGLWPGRNLAGLEVRTHMVRTERKSARPDHYSQGKAISGMKVDFYTILLMKMVYLPMDYPRNTSVTIIENDRMN